MSLSMQTISKYIANIKNNDIIKKTGLSDVTVWKCKKNMSVDLDTFKKIEFFCITDFEQKKNILSEGK